MNDVLVSNKAARKRTAPPVKTRPELLKEYSQLPEDARLDQAMYAARRNCSTALAERQRWAGNGPPFYREGGTIKTAKNGRTQVFGGRIFYLKRDIESFLASIPSAKSTAQAQAQLVSLSEQSAAKTDHTAEVAA